MPARRFATIQKVADLHGCNYQTVNSKIKKGELAAYRLPGKRAHYVDVDEAARVLSKRTPYGTFGPDARVHDLSNVVGAEFEVLD